MFVTNYCQSNVIAYDVILILKIAFAILYELVCPCKIELVVAVVASQKFLHDVN